MRGSALSVLIVAALFALPLAAFAGPPAPHVAPPPPGWNPAAHAAPPAVASTAAKPADVQAAPPAAIPSADASYMSERARLSEQVQILELKAKISDLRKKINGDADPASAAPPSVSLPVPPAPMSSATVASIKIPVRPAAPARPVESTHLIGVVRIGESSRAVISENGSNYKVGLGSALPSGWRVAAITSATVTLARGRAHRTLVLGE
jgi:type IV pilus biogenesis protein PilP